MSTIFKNGASVKTSNLDICTVIEKLIKLLYSYRSYSITMSSGKITPCVEFQLTVQSLLSLAVNDTYEEVSHRKSNSYSFIWYVATLQDRMHCAISLRFAVLSIHGNRKLHSTEHSSPLSYTKLMLSAWRAD